MVELVGGDGWVFLVLGVVVVAGWVGGGGGGFAGVMKLFQPCPTHLGFKMAQVTHGLLEQQVGAHILNPPEPLKGSTQRH